MIDERTFERMERETRQYCVLVTNETTGAQGSGLLYYPGWGDKLYVFTCAHVVDEAKAVQARFFLPKGPEQNEYGICRLTAPADQIFCSPLDKRTGGIGGQFQHTHDAAVIVFYKAPNIQLGHTVYCLSQAEEYMSVYAQGFPGGCGEEDIRFAVDSTQGKIKTVVPRHPIFELRVQDNFLDTGDRELELKGFSGSPLWDLSGNEQCVVGLIAAGKRSNAFRSLVQAVKIGYIQSIMKNRLGVLVESKLPWIPEEDVADRGELCCNGTLPLPEEPKTSQDAWLVEEQQKVHALIDELKLGSAINLCRELKEDPRFSSCSKGAKRLFLQHLMYCYDTCLLEQEAKELEQLMRQEGLIEEHDTGRWLTKLFMLQKYEELLPFAQSVPIGDKDYDYAQFFGAMARAFVLKIRPEETVGLYVDNQERLCVSVKDAATESFYLHIIGYVYDMCYHMPEKAIRCLNRSYRINHQPIICETLAGAYYHLAIRDSLNDQGQIILDRIDQEDLYKARQCFLIIIDQEDELCFKGAVQRMGWEMFHTFVFLHDFYRILTLYPWMKEHFPFKNDEDRRAVERLCAEVTIQSGSIDWSQFPTLTNEDHLLLSFGAEANRLLQAFDAGRLPPIPEVAQHLSALIQTAEQNIGTMSEDGALTLRRTLMLLYRIAKYLFEWPVLEEIKRHNREIQKTRNQLLKEDMEQIVFECGHSYKENVSYFQEIFEKKPSIRSWSALLGIHIRAGNLDKADEMYRDLLSNHKELYEDAPEYAYRAYLDFVRDHQRNLKYALQYFLEGKELFHDKDIAQFWELELKGFTCNFNEPERFETERWPFVEKGLLLPEVYYRGALTAYLENLNAPKADEMFEKLPNPPIRELTWDEMKYLVWRKKVEPMNDPNWQGMTPEKSRSALEQYRQETWGNDAVKTKLVKRFQIHRECVLDAWTLYLLAVQGKLHLLERVDVIYVPHTSVDHLLDEISRRMNVQAREALDFISVCNHVEMVSPDFPHQLKVREKIFYDEPASVVALALEKECVSVIGDPYTKGELFDTFFPHILRPSDIFI